MTPAAESFLSLASVGAVALGLSEEILRCSDADALVVPVNRDYDLDRGELAALRDAAGPVPEIQSLSTVGGTRERPFPCGPGT